MDGLARREQVDQHLEQRIRGSHRQEAQPARADDEGQRDQTSNQAGDEYREHVARHVNSRERQSLPDRRVAVHHDRNGQEEAVRDPEDDRERDQATSDTANHDPILILRRNERD